jgi:uncharacterized protein YyaL (SSP411 family)
MERESFESRKTAAYLNKHYICIKVDREERLDVDGIYMRAIQLFTRGGGGWPMTVWLTPQRKPFYGGTYFPPVSRWGRKSFLAMLKLMKQRFSRDPMGVVRQAQQMTWRLQRMAQLPPAKGVPGKDSLARAAQTYNRSFDPVYGGRRGRPKFPSSLSVPFMLRYAYHTKDPKARVIATTTLTKMAHGGIYDQVGGGFHRYSVDSRWLVPHFEKMLYDNALLVVAYLDGYQTTKRPMYARVVNEVLGYVMRERTSAQGAFYSATDADSEGHEGKFFVWTPAELDRLLGKKASSWLKAYYNVTPRGNFEGKTILHVTRPLVQVAQSLRIKPKVLRASLQRSRGILYKARSKRVPPLSDDKIITSWNALMISAFARASIVLGNARYATVAARAATFLHRRMRRKDGRLYRTYKQGRARLNAYLEDYAFLIAAELDLYEATQQVVWLKRALALQKVLQTYYWDRRGGYFRTSHDHESLLYRPKPRYDGAVPTGNSIQALNLLRLATLTKKAQYRKWAVATFRYFGRRLRYSPTALSEMLLALDTYYDEPKEVILIKPRASSSVQPFLAALRKVFLPNRVLVVTTAGTQQKQLSSRVPLVHLKKPLSGKVTAYVCKRGVCELPTHDPAVFAKQLQKRTTWALRKLR